MWKLEKVVISLSLSLFLGINLLNDDGLAVVFLCFVFFFIFFLWWCIVLLIHLSKESKQVDFFFFLSQLDGINKSIHRSIDLIPFSYYFPININ